MVADPVLPWQIVLEKTKTTEVQAHKTFLLNLKSGKNKNLPATSFPRLVDSIITHFFS